jgi:hypothetical protein
LHQYQHIYLESPGHGFFSAVSILQLETCTKIITIISDCSMNQNNMADIKHTNNLSKPVPKICNSLHRNGLLNVQTEMQSQECVVLFLKYK